MRYAALLLAATLVVIPSLGAYKLRIVRAWRKFVTIGAAPPLQGSTRRDAGDWSAASRESSRSKLTTACTVHRHPSKLTMGR